ncbi:MAG: adenylate/guanylate cyclase domain-containing protein [Verrucomicrobiota bacterium]
MMPKNFRTKLLLAMMLLVISVTVTALLVMEEQVRASYERLFQETSAVQFKSFLSQRETRLDPVREQILNVVRSPRLFALMEESDLEPGDLYRVGLDQLRELLPASQRGEKLSQTAFFVFLNSRGEMILPSSTNTVNASIQGLRPARHFMETIGKFALTNRTQHIGYLAPEVAAGGITLREMVFTPIIHQVSQQALGVLALGFPLPDSSRDGVPSGIWLDGQLYSSSIPGSLRIRLGDEMANQLRKIGPRPQTLGYTVNDAGATFQVYAQMLNMDTAFPPTYQICLFSLAGVKESNSNLRRKMLLFGSAAMMGALALSYLLSLGLSGPIQEVVKGTTEIERGNYTVQLPVRSRDEIGQLAVSFNRMAEGLALKEKYRSVLNMVTDKGVAEELMNGKLALGGELRDISVLFCDIRGFTALTEHMPPTEVIQLLNEHMTVLTRVVYECDGVVDKFVGDLVMAVFGVPKSTGNDASNAARCAQRMIEERHHLNSVSRHSIAIGIGIASGQAVAGCMGSADRLNYTVLGERVNLASRLCSSAKRMEIIVDLTTRERLGNAFKVSALPALTLKGFNQPVPAFQLLPAATTDPHA